MRGALAIIGGPSSVTSQPLRLQVKMLEEQLVEAREDVNNGTPEDGSFAPH
jgi:hypothetical protein